LLVVIAIIAVLAGILFPVFGKAREKGRQASCISNQRQLAQAVMMYAQDHNEQLPDRGWLTNTDSAGADALRCPNAPKSGTVNYTLHIMVTGKALGEIGYEPTSMWLTADGKEEVGGAYGDVVYRHNGKAIASYLDGHAGLLKTAFDNYAVGDNQKNALQMVMPNPQGYGGLWGFGAAYAAFPAGAPNGLGGRILASSGAQLFLQDRPGVGSNPGSWSFASAQYTAATDSWRFPSLPPSGSVTNFSPAASFKSSSVSMLDTPLISISSDGQRIALGIGYNSNDYALYILNSSLLGGTPIDLETDPRVYKNHLMNSHNPGQFVGLSSVAWVGNDTVAILWGDYTNSFVETIPAAGGVFTKVMFVPGASGSMTVDLDGNLYAGIGLYSDASGDRTGEVRVIPAGIAWGTPGKTEVAPKSAGPWPVDFTRDGKLVARQCGCATSLGVTVEGDVFCSGTNAMGTSGAYPGRVYLIRNDLIARVLKGGAPANQNNSLEFRIIMPDPNHDDFYTYVFSNPVNNGLYCSWDPTSNGGYYDNVSTQYQIVTGYSGL